jgi:hypothetical protein
MTVNEAFKKISHAIQRVEGEAKFSPQDSFELMLLIKREATRRAKVCSTLLATERK